MYYTPDDMMNTYVWGWTEDPWRLAAAQLAVWMPLYRPLCEAIYAACFALFGFNPAPLEIFGWLLLVANVVAAYRMLRAVLGSRWAALFGVAVTLTHGALGELYISTGTLFDRLVFLFIAMGVATYAKLRSARQQLRIRDTVLLWLLCVLAMNSKESGVLLPVLLGLYELCFVRERSLGARLKAVGPTFALLAVTAVVFVFGRVYRTPVLLQTAGYHVDPNIGTWWQHKIGRAHV